jgi:hypothetical protein
LASVWAKAARTSRIVRGRIDGLGQRADADVTRCQIDDELDQLSGTPPDPVQAPDDQDVAGPQAVQNLGQAGRRVLAVADVAPDASASRGTKGIELELEGLLLGRDPRVAEVIAAHGENGVTGNLEAQIWMATRCPIGVPLTARRVRQPVRRWDAGSLVTCEEVTCVCRGWSGVARLRW